MVRVYRVEHMKTGRGLYSSFAPTPDGQSNATKRHPMPHMDEALCRAGFSRLLRYYGPGVFFGFASPAQMRRWVHTKKWRKALDKAGWRLVTYELEDETLAALGDTQAVFVRHRARRLRARRIA